MINVFDTSALIYDPQLILNGYPGEDIVIPMTVLREIDHIKSIREHPGSSAREVLRCIDILREQGSLSEGVEREIGGILRIELNNITDTHHLLPEHATVESNDDKIILVAKNIDHNTNEDVFLVTQDRSMSIIAELWGVKSRRHEIIDEKDSTPNGMVTLEVDPSVIDSLYSPEGSAEIEEDIPVNTGVILRSGSSSGLGISNGEGEVHRIIDNISMHGIKPRGAEQIVAANLLLGQHFGDDDREFLGSLSGRAGAGKTILALSAGLYRIMEDHDYNEIIIFRPTEPVGRDLGYLPGNLDEKMKPWAAAIEDVLEAMKLSSTIASKDNSRLENMSDLISIESSNFVRGRTLRNKWVIIEEAQNYEPVVLRTLLSRVGEGSAAVLTWDPSQVDNAYLRKNTAEGPESVLRNLIGNKMVWHMELHNPERGGVSAIIN